MRQTNFIRLLLGLTVLVFALSVRADFNYLSSPLNKSETATASGSDTGDSIDVYLDGNTHLGGATQTSSGWSFSFSTASFSYGAHTITVTRRYTWYQYEEVWGWDAEDNWTSWYEEVGHEDTETVGSKTLIIRTPVTFSLRASALSYNGSQQGPTVVASPGEATFALSGTTSASAVGTYTIVATANGNYTGTSGVLPWLITKASQTISFINPGNQRYGTTLALSATATSGLPVTFEIVSGPAYISGGVVYFTGTGSVQIRASQGGDACYQFAAAVTVAFGVTRDSSADDDSDGISNNSEILLKTSPGAANAQNDTSSGFKVHKP